MEPRHVLAGAMRGLELGDDLIEAHRCCVDNARPVGAQREDVFVHQRPGIKTDRAAGDEVRATEGEQVRRSGACADEVHTHGDTTGFAAVHWVTVIAGRNACLPPTTSRRSTERRVSVPPNLRCAASTTLSVSSVTALAT